MPVEMLRGLPDAEFGAVLRHKLNKRGQDVKGVLIGDLIAVAEEPETASELDRGLATQPGETSAGRGGKRS